ncbi:hypothetical protein HID58_093068, partial [Brassica napus]
WDPGAHRNFTIRGESYGDGKLGELSGDLRINYLITSSIEFQSKGILGVDAESRRSSTIIKGSNWKYLTDGEGTDMDQVGTTEVVEEDRTGGIVEGKGKRRRRRKRGCASLCFQLLVDTTPSLLKCLCSLANGYKLNRASTGVVVLSKWKKRVPHTRNSYPSLNCLWIVGVLKTAILRFFCWFNKLYEQFNVCDHNRRVGILEAWLTTEHNVLVVSTRDLWLVSLNQSQMIILLCFT